MAALILFFKSHVKGYTRKDGVFVKDHENNRHKKIQVDSPRVTSSLEPENKPRLAPNGKPSNLNAMQHAQVRTPEFKEWFGDWETVANLSWLDHGAPVASMSGNEVPALNGMANLADWIAKNWIDRKESIIERSDLGKINIDRKSVKDSAAHGLSKAKVQAYYLVPDVLKSGVLLGEMPPQNNKPRASVIAAPVVIGNVQYKMYIEVRHDENMQRMYVHEAVLREDDSTEAFKTSAATHKEAKPQGAPRGALFSFIQNLRDVKSSKVVDENGEPLVVYHGTPDGRFTEFREDKQASNTKLDDSSGFFFTPDKKYAESYADWEDEDSYIERLLSGNDAPNNANKDIKPVYLRIINPIDANTGHKGSKEIFNAAKENGNDGVFSNQTANKMNEIVAFNPNQIKSAIGNSGGFSKESNNIHKALFFGNTTEILNLMKRL